MRSFFYFAYSLVAFLIVAAKSQDNVVKKTSNSLVYPKVHRVSKTWSYRSAKAKGNVTYADPYFWLEGSAKEKDIQQFVADQTKLTEQYIQGCKSKDAIIKSLTEANSFDSFTHSSDEAPMWYTASFKEFAAAKQNNFQSPPGKKFLNESLLSSDGSQAIIRTSVSPDGNIFGYQVVGADGVANWYFRHFNSPLLAAKTTPAGGEGSLNDMISLGAPDSLFWMPDSKAFFYSQIVDSNGGTNTDHGYKVRYHIWGTNSTKDVTIFDTKNAGSHGSDNYYYLNLSPDGRWLVVTGYHDISTYNTSTYATLLPGQQISENMKWISLSPAYEFSVIRGGIVGDTYYFYTNKDAKNGKIAKIKMDWSKAKKVKLFTELQDRPPVIDVVPERQNSKLIPFGVFMTAKNVLILVYIEQGEMAVYSCKAGNGKLLKKLLPTEKVYVDDFIPNRYSNTSFLLAESWNTPSKIFEFKWDGENVQSSRVTVQHINNTNPDDFAVEKLYATSKDGTKVPYFITYRKGTQKPGPAFIHMYAASGVVDNLFYQSNYFEFLRSYNGYFIWAGARGGGDEGGKWHDAGSGLNKQKTFDDIIAIAQDIVKLGYTTAGNIIIEGVSAGGLAVAAVLNQAPAGLIGLALPVRAPCDAFQFELRSTIGAVNRVEFGDVTTPEGFDAVFAWSPLQNVDLHKPYPAVVLTPGSSDEVVPPSSSYKFLAQLQYDHPNNTLPLLMYVAQNLGHVPATVLESTYHFCVMEQALHLRRRNE
ncbi:alpha/beta-hydrolase [Meira miltonrushii]|uniref:Prolyl endopeptidase n=1 Tax=Meira miltonrushii TaxID=1280837 RepID=A0A316V392_9BASI|nr:alpha/beta-hydrolase [Meira miltonrushii]PWN31724.1 alpha/beta-hydrolase [Meira miltonrushii]